MSNRYVRICPDCGTSLSVDSTTCWLCKERSKPVPRSIPPAVIQQVDEDRPPSWTITWTYQHRWTFYLIASVLYAASIAFLELNPYLWGDRSLAVGIFALVFFFKSCGLVAGMILIIDLVFGARAFRWRLLEGLLWVLLTLGIYGCFLTLGNPNENQTREIGSRCLGLPLVILSMQIPLWGIAYAKKWQLRRDDAPSDRAHWSIRDWMLGCVLLSATFALARSAGEAESVVISAISTLLWGLFLLLPAVLYGLLPRDNSVTCWGVGVHGLLLFFLLLWQFAVLFANGGAAFHYQLMLLIAFIFSHTPPIIAVFLLRWSGYRLRAASAAPADQAGSVGTPP